MAKLKSFHFFIIVFILGFLSLSFNSGTKQERPQEEVTVVAVEVPVRVLYKGRDLKDLTREDFEIYQNGVKQKITGFEVHSRKIAISKDTPEEELKIKPEKRLFILIFNIFDYQENIGQAIDYFFENFFSPGDQLIILTEDRIFDIEKGKNVSDVALNLKDTLRKFKLISTFSIYKAYKDLRLEADRLLWEIKGAGLSSDWDRYILRFYENYQRVWKDYKRQFITPNFDLYRSVIKRVKQIEGEKWALCFLQRELFPELKNEGPLDYEIRHKVETPSDNPVISAKQRIVISKQMELLRLFDISGIIPVEAMKSLFMEANVTFHLIFLRSQKTLLSKDFELKEVSQDYEDCFRQISFSTGGHTTFSNKVVEALKEASESEDYYYLLVYSPEADLSDEGVTIDVKVKKEGADVIHLKRFVKEVITPVRIADFEVQRKRIKFSLIDYQRIEMQGKLTGIADVKITLFDDQSQKVFDEAKTLSLTKDQARISIPFSQLKSGNYFLIIQVVDKINNAIDVLSKQIKL